MNILKRWKELKQKEEELWHIKQRAIELQNWCAAEFPEVGCAAKWVLNPHDAPYASGGFGNVSCFREALRKGLCDREAATKTATQD